MAGTSLGAVGATVAGAAGATLVAGFWRAATPTARLAAFVGATAAAGIERGVVPAAAPGVRGPPGGFAADLEPAVAFASTEAAAVPGFGFSEASRGVALTAVFPSDAELGMGVGAALAGRTGAAGGCAGVFCRSASRPPATDGFGGWTLAGGDTAGGDTAGGDTAGGDTAGGDTAGGGAARARIGAAGVGVAAGRAGEAAPGFADAAVGVGPGTAFFFPFDSLSGFI